MAPLAVEVSNALKLLIALSSFVIVPMALLEPNVALVGDDSVTVKVSSLSLVVSPHIGTVIVPEVAPAKIVTVPVVVI